MSRDISTILRLGAGEDLAAFFDAAVSVLETWEDWTGSHPASDTAGARIRLQDAVKHAQACLDAIYHGHKGPAETAAEARLRELRNA